MLIAGWKSGKPTQYPVRARNEATTDTEIRSSSNGATTGSGTHQQVEHNFAKNNLAVCCVRQFSCTKQTIHTGGRATDRLTDQPTVRPRWKIAQSEKKYLSYWSRQPRGGGGWWWWWDGWGACGKSGRSPRAVTQTVTEKVRGVDLVLFLLSWCLSLFRSDKLSWEFTWQNLYVNICKQAKINTVNVVLLASIMIYKYVSQWWGYISEDFICMSLKLSSLIRWIFWQAHLTFWKFILIEKFIKKSNRIATYLYCILKD